MNGRAIVNIILTLVVVGVLVAIGGGIYQAGVSQGIVDAGRVPVGAAVGVAGYGGGFHAFGFLGLLFPIFFIFLLFGLLRAAFGRGRGWGHGYGHGYGYGPGWDKGMSAGPDAWHEERDRRMAELHRRLHEADGSTGTAGQGTDASSGGSSGPAAR